LCSRPFISEAAREVTAYSCAVSALNFNPAVMQFDEPVHKCETKACTGALTGATLGGEALEHICLNFGRKAWPGIGNRDLHVLAFDLS
jgi:hypothetical protein